MVKYYMEKSVINKNRYCRQLAALFLAVFVFFCIIQNCSTYAEENYIPTSFLWSGGSGRLKGMECSAIQIRDNQAWATICIKSQNYIYIKVADRQYDRIQQGEKESIFEIPVELNTEMKILACTVAMSAEHEIEYTIYVGYDPESPGELPEVIEDPERAEEDAGIMFDSEIFDREEENAPELPGLEFISKMKLTFARGFDVYNYEEGYKVISVHNDRKYLVIPEGKELPEKMTEEMVVLYQPLDQIYLAATAAMSLFDAIDSLDAIRLSSVKTSGWYIENAVKAMEEGSILFAGKYSEPDYELLIGEECDLAIESTMIKHSPKVQEMIEAMDIPVLVDWSSYEAHPLGRTEWVKLYGALVNKEEEAEVFFEKQAKIIEQLKDFQNTEKTVAFFYISSDGSVVVRTPEDYVPKMIEIAGGRYLFDYLPHEEGKKSSVNLTMEEFYVNAMNADYLVYNATIDDPISSIEDLLGKDILFADFKAVQNGNVWCAGKYLYQATDIVGNMITDLNLMLTDGDDNEMTFLTRIQ